MCGIVGYIGYDDSKEILLKGLEKLEYRGYDSAGIATLNDEDAYIAKVKGRIAQLREAVDDNVEATLGIGHTRWATHGPPSQENAHPHQSTSGRFTIVHNGVIENYLEVRKEYLGDMELKSQTDTEIIVQLIEVLYNEMKDVAAAFRKAVELLKGSYAIALIDAEDKDTIYIAKNKSPLLVGLGDGFNVVASDSMAMLQVTDQFLELMDKETVLLRRDSVEILKLDGSKVARAFYS